MIDFTGMHDELTKSFILREYQERIPQLTMDFEQKAIELYRNDPIFHNRVDHLVSAIMVIIQRYITSNTEIK